MLLVKGELFWWKTEVSLRQKFRNLQRISSSLSTLLPFSLHFGSLVHSAECSIRPVRVSRWLSVESTDCLPVRPFLKTTACLRARYFSELLARVALFQSHRLLTRVALFRNPTKDVALETKNSVVDCPGRRSGAIGAASRSRAGRAPADRRPEADGNPHLDSGKDLFNAEIHGA